MTGVYFQLILLSTIVIYVVDGKLHVMERVKRQTQLFGTEKAQVSNNMPQPIPFADLTKVLLDQAETHKRLHRLAAPPNPIQIPTGNNMFQHDDPGFQRGQKQPFIFHIAQDFMSAAVNFLFNFMI